MAKRILAVVAVIASIAAITSVAPADVPQLISFQGKLYDNAGNPVTGEKSITFRIYAVESGGTQVWSETKTVTCDNGLYSVILGQGTPINLDFNGQYWLGVHVAGDSELSPRCRLVSVPTAFRAEDANSVNGIPASTTPTAYHLFPLGADGKFPTSVLPPTPAPGPHAVTHNEGGTDPIIVTSSLIQDKTVSTADLADNAVTTAKIQPDVVSSVDKVTSDGGNIDLVPQNAVTITPNNTAKTITIGETHSVETDNPHNTTAAQTGALVSVEGVSNPGGNINLVSGSNIAISHDDAANTITISSNSWSLNGNSGMTPGSNYLGTRDNAALELKVNSSCGFRLEPTPTSINIIGGYYDNSVTSGVAGATVGGGGAYGSLNLVTDNFGTVGGGLGNQAGDNAGNTSDCNCATVGGGAGNEATGYASTVGGGSSNEATGNYSTIPGGTGNVAQGQYSFAAGRRAKANDGGSFVWGDNTNADVASTAANQFVVRARGGVYLYTNSALTTGMYLSGSGSGWNAVSDRAMKANIRPVDKRSVLNSLISIPISQWNYRTQDSSIQHIGPMAQDWDAAFGLGEDDKSINSIDCDGVALAAIQGLYEMVLEKDVKIAVQQQQIDAQQKQIIALEGRLAALESRMK